MKSTKIIPHLAVVQVGADPASIRYIAGKKRAAERLGMKFSHHRLETTQSHELRPLLDGLNNDPSVHGIILQKPVPFPTDDSWIHPAKDVDGFHPMNIGKLWGGDLTGFVACTPWGIYQWIRHLRLPLGHAVVVGRSNTVGKPMAALLLSLNYTVTIAHSRTQDLQKIIASADLLVAAAGQQGLIKLSSIKKDAHVFDVGIHVKPDGKLTGDVEEGALDHATITAVPGGVGPLTVAFLMANTIRAAGIDLKL